MVATPNVTGVWVVLINPFFFKILLKASPKGKKFADSLRYEYAILSFEKSLPITGKIKEV